MSVPAIWADLRYGRHGASGSTVELQPMHVATGARVIMSRWSCGVILAIGRTLKTPPSARSFLLCSLGPPAGLQVVPWRSISTCLDGAFRTDDFVLLGVFAGSAGRHCVFQGPHQSDAPASAFALCRAISKLPGHGPGSIAPTPTPHRRQIIVYSLYFNPHTHCLSGLGQRPPKLSIKCRLVDALFPLITDPLW